jgi:hypothetical protein
MLIIVQWFIVFAALPVCAAVWMLSARYRDDTRNHGARPLFTVLCVLASWYVAIVFVYFIGGNHTAAVMLSVLWATVGIAWSAISMGKPRVTVRLKPVTVMALNVDAPNNDRFVAAMARKKQVYESITARL